MSENKRLLKIISKNHEFKILHHEIELELGRTVSSDQVIDMFASIGISLFNLVNHMSLERLISLIKNQSEEELIK